jgi:hypothetical protein
MLESWLYNMQHKKLTDATKAIYVNSIERKAIYIRKKSPNKNGAHLVKKFASNKYANASIAKTE